MTHHHDALSRNHTSTYHHDAVITTHNHDTISGRKKRRNKDMVDKAMTDNPRELLDCIRAHIGDEIETPKMGPSDWNKALPSWFGRGKSRGLKEWNSKTKRHNWCVGSLCAKAVNAAVTVYMRVVAVPPVKEGEMNDDHVLVFKEGGLDLFITFLHCVHRCYCKFLNPEVEVGLEAFTTVLQYMNTPPIKLKLLRAVRHDTSSRNTFTTHFHDTVRFVTT